MVTYGKVGLMYGVALAGLSPRLARGWGATTLLGLVLGVMACLVLVVVIGPLANPAMRMAPAVHFFTGHLMFGLVTAWSLFALARNQEIAVIFAPAAGVAETQRVASRR